MREDTWLSHVGRRQNVGGLTLFDPLPKQPGWSEHGRSHTVGRCRECLNHLGEGGGQAKLRTIEGGVLLARMNGPTNVVLVDENGNTADIAIYDVYDKNGVMHVVDRMLEPGGATRQMAAK